MILLSRSKDKCLLFSASDSRTMGLVTRFPILTKVRNGFVELVQELLNPENGHRDVITPGRIIKRCPPMSKTNLVRLRYGIKANSM